MKSRILRPLVCLFAMFLVLATTARAAWAEEARDPRSQACRSSIVGTYLTIIENSDGSFSSRSIVSFHDDGSLEAVDSAQSTGVQDSGFSEQLGQYSCKSRTSAVAITLDFGFPDIAGIARSDWVIDITPERTIEGEITLNLFVPIETCNPFDPQTCTLTDMLNFTFTSVRVPAQLDQ